MFANIELLTYSLRLFRSLPVSVSFIAQVYGVAFYHFMEFTSSTPPPNLVPYFAAEGPYAVSVLMVLL